MEIQTDRRREASYERKMRRWCYSLDAVDDKSSWYVDCNWNEDRDGGEELRNRKHKEWKAKFNNAKLQLTSKQQQLINALVYEEKTQQEYADEIGADKSTISKRYKAAMRRMRKHI